MRFKGDANADFGFKVVSDGYHKAYFTDGIDIKLNEASGKTSVWLPLIIDGGEDDGAKITMFLPYKDEKNFGEQRLANVLSKAGLFAMFEEKFPGDVSLFDTKVFDLIKLKLNGKFVKIKVERSKDGKNANIANMYTVDAVIDDKPKGSAKEKVAKEPTAPATDWE